MNITLSPELERLVRETVARGDYENAAALVEDAVHRLIVEDKAKRDELQRAIRDGVDDFSEYDERTIKNFAEEVHERGLKRLAERRKTGTRG